MYDLSTEGAGDNSTFMNQKNFFTMVQKEKQIEESNSIEGMIMCSNGLVFVLDKHKNGRVYSFFDWFGEKHVCVTHFRFSCIKLFILVHSIRIFSSNNVIVMSHMVYNCKTHWSNIILIIVIPSVIVIVNVFIIVAVDVKISALLGIIILCFGGVIISACVSIVYKFLKSSVEVILNKFILIVSSPSVSVEAYMTVVNILA